MATPISAWLWYRGDRFRGYQAQPQGPTVQQALEEALEACGVRRGACPAGRTDRGVHARMQVASVRVEDGTCLDELSLKLRAVLPEGLGLCAIKPAPRGFHAQWSATGKEYRYRLWLGVDHASQAWVDHCWAVGNEPRLGGGRPSPERIATLLRHAEGARDFIAFHEKSSPRRTRTLRSATLWHLAEHLYEVRLSGDGFARYQARYLVGSAVATAAGEIPQDRYCAALDRGQEIAGLKAPAHGLILWEVRYPEDKDPFSASEREGASGVPAAPPFRAPAGTRVDPLL